VLNRDAWPSRGIDTGTRPPLALDDVAARRWFLGADASSQGAGEGSTTIPGVSPASHGRRASAPAVRVGICTAGEIWGGVEQFVVTLADALDRSRFSPVALLFHDGLLAARLRDRGVDVHCLTGRGKRDLRVVGDLRRILAREHVGLLHVHGYKAAVVAAMARTGLRIPIVKTEHGLTEPLERWSDVWEYGRLAANQLMARVLTRAAVDARVFVSRDTERRLTRRNLPGRVIYNGLPAGDQRDAAFEHRPDEFHIAIVGRLSRVKGHRHLLGALTRLRSREGVRLHVFGCGPLEAECREFCATHGLLSSVRFHGFSESLREQLRSMDLVAMPSLHEGLPFTLLEAMAAGVPVVAAAVGGLKEVLEGSGCGVLVPPGDEAALAEAIEQLRRDPARRARMAARARREVTRRFSATAMAEQYAAVYERTLEVGA
jgi:L-malate glycosyltransferase